MDVYRRGQRDRGQRHPRPREPEVYRECRCADAHQQYPDLPAAQRPAYAGCDDGQLIVDESDKDEAGNAKVVGSFTVDTDGTVTLTFTDEKFIGTNDKGGLTFTGTFKAAVTASADNFEDKKEIKFKDDCILTIKKKTADIKISKGSGSPLITDRKDGTFVNNYEVTVGTTNGTKDPVILTDTLNTNRNGENRSDYLKGGKYLVDSFKLYKVDASGTKRRLTSLRMN